MKILCVIPARGGSKRIPKKNIKDFFGKPLITYSIEVAKKSELFDDIVVSTDDKKIADIAQKYGATVQFRPKELSDDFTGTGDVVKYVLNSLAQEDKKYDFVCTIYATAPLLQIKYLKEGFEKLKNSDAHQAFSVTSMPFPIQRTFKITQDGRCKMFTPEHFSSRSQDLEEAYQDAGQFYLERLSNNFTDIPFGKDSIPIVLPRHLVQDLDTQEDWERLEIMYQTINQDNYDKWNKLKKQISTSKRKINIKNQDIYLLQIGKNIGVETYGKGDNFLRPVLVYKKLGHKYFIGIPLSSKNKQGSYFFNFRYKQNVDSCAMLNQMRVFDSSRIIKIHGKISKKTYKNLKIHINNFFEFPLNNVESGCQLGLKSLSTEINKIITKEEKDVKQG